MGRLIKNHWARLIVFTAGIYQVAASISGFIWPKIFFDFLTRELDAAIAPLPYLQVINLIFGLIVCAWEWPLCLLAGSAMHRSIEARLVFLPLTILSSALLYQATNPAIYYTVGILVYFWAYSEGEVVAAEPWTLPSKSSQKGEV